MDSPLHARYIVKLLPVLPVTSFQPPLSSSGSSASDSLGVSPPVIIRVAQYQDLPKLADLLVDSFHHSTGWLRLFYPLMRLSTQEDLRHRISSGSSTYMCLVAIVQDTDCIVGTIEMTLQASVPWQLRKGQHLYISSLAVHRDYRRCGIARQLLLNCEKTARVMGFHDLYLHVLDNNQPARQLYLAMNYQLQCSDPDWLALLPGQPQRLLLHKQLLPLATQQPTTCYER